MERRRFLKNAAVTGAAAGAAAAFPAPAVSQNRIHWRMALAWPKNAPILARGPQILAEFVEKASDGRMTIEISGAGELVPPLQILDAVAAGTVESAQSYPTFWAGKDPAFNMVAPLPFGITTQEQHAWLTFGGGQELCDKVYNRHGVKFFPLGNTSVQGTGWFTKEINTIDDFQGLKMRIGGLSGQVLRQVGVTVVVIPLGEVLQALQSGAIDAAEFVGPYNDMSFGLYRAAKYYYWPGVVEPCGIVDMMVNMDAWQSLPPDLQEIVRAGTIYGNFMEFNEWVAKNAEAMQVLQNEHKVEFRYFSDDILKKLGTIAGEVVAEEANKDPLAKEMLESLIKFRATMMPYTELSEAAFLRARNLDFPYVSL